jgi:hypothetical protein
VVKYSVGSCKTALSHAFKFPTSERTKRKGLQERPKEVT